eukprot:CAMPEP_0173171932 /NCGR_PEP_ID=MMETSP1141-20130122/2029_1 /TAXON_ID=483371 /ORGANISM="non described non described, Strain CCMP2298" /LENGTH=217 /DNA_ID=CAMNT_0014093915 /DNA_START=222 /DNA_END=874 /DNA_ORIENTATION=-
MPIATSFQPEKIDPLLGLKPENTKLQPNRLPTPATTRQVTCLSNFMCSSRARKSLPPSSGVGRYEVEEEQGELDCNGPCAHRPPEVPAPAQVPATRYLASSQVHQQPPHHHLWYVRQRTCDGHDCVCLRAVFVHEGYECQAPQGPQQNALYLPAQPQCRRRMPHFMDNHGGKQNRAGENEREAAVQGGDLEGSDGGEEDEDQPQVVDVQRHAFCRKG